MKRRREADASEVADADAAEELPPLQSCFIEGDLVEAVFVEGYWVPAKVVATKARQLLVQYERAQFEELSQAQSYECRENETPRDVARRFGLQVHVLLKLNEGQYAELSVGAKLRRGTLLRMPVLYMTHDNESPKEVALRFGRDVDELVDLNSDANNGLHQSSKLKSGTMLSLPQRVDRTVEVAAVEAKELPPQLQEKLEVLVEAEVNGDRHWQPAELRKYLPLRKFQVILGFGLSEDVEIWWWSVKFGERQHFLVAPGRAVVSRAGLWWAVVGGLWWPQSAVAHCGQRPTLWHRPCGSAGMCWRQ